jgi:hypothetical protein
MKFKEFHQLSATEKQLLAHLTDLKGKSFLKECIDHVCQSGDAAKFRQMLRDLRSQVEDGANGVKSVIGAEAMTVLLTVK